MDKVLLGPIGSTLTMMIVINNGFISGMTVSWTGASLAKVNDDATMAMSLRQASIAVSIFYAGQAMATLPYSYGERAFGKRRMLQIGITFTVAGWLVIYFTENHFGSYLGRFMLGVWLSMSILSTSPYLAEVAVPRRRGIVVSFVSIQFMTGAILESVLAIYLTYFRLALFNLTVGTFQLISLQLIPESPYFFMKKGRIDAARESFRWFRGPNIGEFERTLAVVKEQMTHNSRYADIFKYPASRSAFSFGLLLLLFQRVSSILPIFAYAAYVFPDAVLKPEHLRILFYCISLVCVMVSGNSVDRIGRRKLLIVSAVGSCTFCTTTTAWVALNELTTIDLRKANWVPLISSGGEIAFNAIGGLYIPSILISELFPVNVKGKALTLLHLSQLVLIILNVKLFMTLKEIDVSFAIHVVYCLVVAISCFYYVHMYDTKGQTLEDIHAHFDAKGRRRSTFINTIILIKQFFTLKEKNKYTKKYNEKKHNTTNVPKLSEHMIP